MATRKVTTTKKAAPKTTKVVASSLDPRLFAKEVSEKLITQVLHVYKSRSHQGTYKVKTRGEVNRTTKKVYKQKGTGNARHGARSAPIYVGGGVSHGPTGVLGSPLKVNRKMAATALVGLLTNKAKEKAVELVSIPTLNKPEVKSFKALFSKEKALVIHEQENEHFYNSARNLDNVTLTQASKLNPYQIALHRHLYLTSKAQEVLLKRVLPLIKSK